MSEARAVGAAAMPKAIAVYGFDDGSLRRTTDYASTESVIVKEASGVPVQRVWWEPVKRAWWAFWRRQRWVAYALMANGERYRSFDDGLTWEKDIINL